jgi:DNA-directed RNA polymerase subunit omega
MARITIEDCLNKVNNRFSLIHIAAKRVRQLRKGSESTVFSKNKDIVVALREIAAGNVEMSLRTAAPGDLEADSDNVLLPGPIEEVRERAAGEEEKEA